MGKTNKNSKDYSFEHIKQRMMERHGIDISNDEYDIICTKYNNNIISKENDQHVFEYAFKGKMLKFVWSNKRKRVTTVLW